MPDHAAAEAAAMLHAHWQVRSRMPSLPEMLRPATRAEGYAIQARLVPGEIVGWKIAATNVAGQRHINVDGPLVGRYAAGMVLPDGAEVSLRGNAMRVAEPEFAFTLGRDLAPREGEYALAEVMDAVAELRIGIEVPDSRFADFTAAGGPQLIADNACALLHVLGRAAEDWRGLDLAAAGCLAKVGARYEREGIGANVLGDPRVALTWMVNEMTRLGTTLRAGQFVTTGTCATPLAILPGDEVAVDFGRLGTVSARFVE
ncbi:hydratase [Dankookia rubra]|uniref:Hydratase n=1 Tax=Dankookia rubra TaxID=1442381 RepID=A0A4V3A9M0_9PROT|nr:fumarylacetoacetate hydrolase family protein [Dankookia rubra]TDH59775.1 hydratase [Dankookia rubra]